MKWIAVHQNEVVGEFLNEADAECYKEAADRAAFDIVLVCVRIVKDGTMYSDNPSLTQSVGSIDCRHSSSLLQNFVTFRLSML
jgi:hypothetical protein